MKKSIISIMTKAIFASSLCAIHIPQLYAQMQESINTIEAIDANGNSQNASINIKLSKGLLGEPSSSVITNPNRLIIDLPNTINGLKDSITYNHALFKDIRITTIDNRSRLVLNLNQNITHEIIQNGKLLTVQIKAINNAAANTSDQGKNTYANSAASALIKGIDFQRSGDGAGKVILNLSNRDTIVDIKQQGSSLVADFMQTKAMDNLKRSYDVNDFATPVKSMRLMPYNNGTRLQLDPKGAWRYSSYQADDKFIIEVHPIKVDAATQKVAQNQKYSGKKLSLNFQDIDIRSLMQVFGDFTNLNIIVNDNVQGNMTLRLKDVPWDQAFDIVLQSKNLGSRRNGNIIWVAPKDEMLAKEKQELEGKAQIADLEPLKTQTIQLQYHKADVVFKALMGQGEGAGANTRNQALISKRGSVIMDTRTNQLFVTDIPSKLEEITQMIAKIDIPVKQVLIEARIVEANETFGRNLGVKLGTVDLRDPKRSGLGLSSDNRLAVSGNQSGSLQTYGLLAPEGGTNGLRYDVNNTNFVNLPAAAINGFSAAGLGLSLFNKNAQILLNLELSALEAEGKGKIVSSPRILTTDKQKALIEQGTELPYESATSSGATSVQFKKANLKLEVTPQITPEGKVFLDVDINKDSPSAITNGRAGLAIDTKHVQTQILVDNGGTVMIGGIFEESDRKNTTKVPFLGDLPVVGNLFKTTSRNKERNELLIFLTPKVVETTPYKQ
jgi:type IV pilus assembly protein PilQ